MKDSGRLSKWKLVLTLTCLGSGLATPGSLVADGEAEGKSRVREKCILEAAGQVDLRSEVGRPLPIVFLVPEGKVAKEGTLLLELDSAALTEEMDERRTHLTQAKAEAVAIEASLEADRLEASAAREVAQKALQVAEGALKVFLSEKGEYQLERKKRLAAIHSSEKKLVAAKTILKAVEQHVEAGQAGVQDLQQVQIVIAQAESEIQVAQAELQFLEDVLKSQRVAELELQIVTKKFDLIRAESCVRRAELQGEAELIAARASLDMAKLQLERTEHQVKACRIVSPKAGTVVYPGGPGKGGIRRGAVVRPRQLLLRIMDAKRLKTVVRTGLEVAQRTAPGQSVKIRVDAYPDRDFQGRITRVGVVRPARPGGVAEITVLLDNPDGKLRPGMTAVVEIGLSEE